MHLPIEITQEISDYFSGHFDDNPDDFVCVYGSSVYSPDKKSSDVDLFAVARQPGSIALGPLVAFVKDLHVRHGRKLDAEVPYENKVHYTYDEVENAVSFAGFEIDANRVVVPPIKKEAAFLGSVAMKSRLVLNGLTTPHSVIGKEFGRYHSVRSRAGEAVTLLAISLQEKEEFSIDHLQEALTYDKDGLRGEMYLGYKTEYPIVKEHLYGVLAGALDRLVNNGVVSKVHDDFYVDWESFRPYNYMIATRPKD